MTSSEREFLIQILKEAKGELSLDEFSARTGISKFQLSRIMNGKFKEMPRKATLAAIAEHSTDDFAKEVLETYLNGSFLQEMRSKLFPNRTDDFTHIANTVQEQRAKEEYKKLIRSCKSQILTELSDFPFDWSVKYRKIDPSLPLGLQPMLEIGTGGHGGIQKWLFYCEPDVSQYEKGFFYTFLGKIMCENISSECKISLVITDQDAYNELSGIDIPNMNCTFSLIFLDFTKDRAACEAFLYIAPGSALEQLNEISIAAFTDLSIWEEPWPKKTSKTTAKANTT